MKIEERSNEGSRWVVGYFEIGLGGLKSKSIAFFFASESGC
jgi:hypothetical protein